MCQVLNLLRENQRSDGRLEAFDHVDLDLVCFFANCASTPEVARQVGLLALLFDEQREADSSSFGLRLLAHLSVQSAAEARRKVHLIDDSTVQVCQVAAPATFALGAWQLVVVVERPQVEAGARDDVAAARGRGLSIRPEQLAQSVAFESRPGVAR